MKLSVGEEIVSENDAKPMKNDKIYHHENKNETNKLQRIFFFFCFAVLEFLFNQKIFF